ncbi:unconventional myosin-IXb-like isoform X2 [Hetaerina americana]|uniref:unconventional myosin-IXb-like isoform X2 n=1 Tax=Hetaerina americana TaxID=62018 RepID=UPI003A7F413F
MAENNRYIVQVFVGALSQHYEALSVEASKQTSSEEIVCCIVDRLSLKNPSNYELAEVIGNSVGQECKERRVGPVECPVALMLLWPKACSTSGTDDGDQQEYRFYLREKLSDSLWTDSFSLDPQLIRDYFYRFLYQPKDKEYPDLCQLPDLNEQTLLDNLRARFCASHIYTYVGSILIAVNPFKFYPIYNPKYVKLYQSRRLGELPPHIFAIADAAYHSMLKDKCNQCIVISGESGSGKTESTNFLLHHLTALSQKGRHGSGVEQTILSAGPVLEAFGNAKTAHNNNSSRFGKFIQVNYKENGMVHGAVVQKYLLEKSRICSQGRNERNYHVFYYLLAGASDAEKQALHLQRSEDYHYLSRSGCYVLDNVDEKYEFSRLKQSMEMVGFTAEKQRRLFSVLSAVLLLGNVEFQPRKSAYHHDESVGVRNPEVVLLISELLRVRQETLLAALTAKRARASGETLIINYRLPEAIAARDAMAKCLYGALFDWIVLQVNHALFSKKDTLRDHQGNSIGVLDIFGFEDFGKCNSFEQFCINYANEHLQYYFNQHVFKYEQEEYRKEGIRWKNIDFMDNTGCLQLIEGKPSGLLCILDDQCNFPGATSETLLQKFNSVHKENNFYEVPQKREAAFIVRHYAGKVKYQVAEVREKNLDLMRQDIVGVLKNSSMAFVRELVGADPVAVFRWAIVRAFFRAYFAFLEAGRKHRLGRVDGNKAIGLAHRFRAQPPNEHLISLRKPSSSNAPISPKRTLANEIIVPNAKNASMAWRQQAQRENVPPGHKSLSEWKESVSTMDHVSSQEAYMGKQGSRRESVGALDSFLGTSDAQVLERANQIVMKNKSFRPRERGKKGLKNLEVVKTLAGRTQSYGSSQLKGVGARKQPLTVTAQFQQSLHSLMDTLNQANPFFIRCIKSNSDKIPNKFDDDTVQRQLRYTGMLETVRIRQAGYNVRLTYEEFIQLYRILLPKGLLSSQYDVRNFLLTLNLNRDNYQLGMSKIFLRESEKVKLDYRLHQQIMASIINIQRWFRAVLERRHFLRIRKSVIIAQSFWKMVLAQRQLMQLKIRHTAAIIIQKIWRGYKVRSWYNNLCNSVVRFQANVRGNFARERFKAKLEELKRRQGHRKQVLQARKNVSALQKEIDTHSAQSTDEAFMSKESSQEELDEHISADKDDSEGSSGIQEDSEAEIPHRDSVSYNHQSSINVKIMPSKVNKNPSPKPKKLLSGEETTYSPHDKTWARVGKVSYKSAGNTQGKIKKKASPKRSKEPGSDLMRLSYNETADLSNVSALRLDEVKSYGNPTPTSKTSLYQKNSDPPGVPVKDTFHRAKRQIQALVGGNRKPQKWDGSASNHSDSELEENQSDTSSYEKRLSESSLPGQDVDPSWRRRADTTDCYNVSVAPITPVEPPRRSSIVRGVHITAVNRVPVHREEEGLGGGSREPVPWARTRRKDAFHSMGVGVAPASANTRWWSSEPQQMSRDLDSSGSSRTSVPYGLRSDERTEPIPGSPSEWPIHIGSLCVPLDGVSEESGVSNPTATKGHSYSPSRKDLDLRRRNSDPAKCEPSSSQEIEWKGTMFKLAGHSFRKIARFSKEDKCDFCSKSMDAFVTQGHKCTDCKQIFHTKCIQNGGVLQMPCQQTSGGGKPGRRKYRKHSRTPYDMNKPGKFNLTGTSEFTDSTDKIISDARELQLMQDFITKKIYKIESEEGQKPSQVDRVFKQALREFKDNLVATYSIVNKQGAEALNIKYKDLIANFLHVMETVCNQDNAREDFPVTMGVNAFRGFMNEFMNLNRLDEKPKTKRKKEKKRKIEDPIIFSGHTFVLTIINIPTACEICTSFFMWPIERGLVCQNCKLTCHKKCYSKVTVECGKDGSKEDYMSGGAGGKKRVFGAPLSLLVFGDGASVPLVVDRLITTIEMYGLYTEGIYRKSGVSSKVRELKARIEDEGVEVVNLECYQVHVLASVLKCLFREMPEPLLTFEGYEDFIRSADLTDPKDRVSTLFAILKKLPKPNFDLMERLIFHLARVALHEDANRMNASALAIVFAPCILRTDKEVPAQDSLSDIGRQTQCIETIIQEQLRKVRSTLADIDTLDTACHTASHRLSSLRSSKVFTVDELLRNTSSASTSMETSVDSGVGLRCSRTQTLRPDEEEALLAHHIEEIQKEKALLTSTLPSLTRTTSDDDLLSTDPDGSLDDVATVHTPSSVTSTSSYIPYEEEPPKSTSNPNAGVQLLPTRHRTKKRGGGASQRPASGPLPRQHASGSWEAKESEDMTGSQPVGDVPRKVDRQSSSDTSVVSLYLPHELECEEDPIMV